jgi:hypothetical protein
MEMDIREQHLELLADEFMKYMELEWDGEYIESGNPKRPFGNSDVLSDVIDVIGWIRADYDDVEAHDKQNEYAVSLLNDLGKHIQKRWKEIRLALLEQEADNAAKD